MLVKDFKCAVCESVGNWKNIDADCRVKPEGTHMCLTCGFVSYPERFKTEDQIKEYYRTEYRGMPQVDNIKSGERKLQYHEFFLTPLLKEWESHGVDKPVVGEVGAAMGMFLNWLKKKVPGAEVHGCELTTTFRKVAFFEYGIRLEEDFDFSRQYDLIASYHVLEHQMEPDVKLKQYRDCLKDHGVMYLSVPIWGQALHCDAVAGFDLEYYWHPDHFNAWTEQHLEWLFKKAGLKVIFKNDNVYGNTYILQKTDEPAGDMPAWNPDKCLEFAKLSKQVWLLIQEHKSAEAIALYQNCVTAWIHNYEFKRAEFDKNREQIDTYLENMRKACPNSADAWIFSADVVSRYERYPEALKFYNLALNRKPNSAMIIMGISTCYRNMAIKEKDPKLKAAYLKMSLDALQFVRSISLDMTEKAISWMFHDMSYLEIPKGGKDEKVISSADAVLN